MSTELWRGCAQIEELYRVSPVDAQNLIRSLLDLYRTEKHLTWTLATAIFTFPLNTRFQWIIDMLHSVPSAIFKDIAQDNLPENIKFPEKFLINLNSPEIKPDPILYSGLWALFNQNYNQAEMKLQSWIQSHKSSPSLNSIAMLLLVSVYRMQNSFQRALELLLQIDRILPENSMIWTRIGELQVELKRMVQAEEAFKKAHQYDPQNAEAWIQHMWLAIELKQFDAASSYIENAKMFEPNNPIVLCSEADLLAINNHDADAVPIYQKAIAQNPYLLTPLKNLALSYMQLKQYDLAESTAKMIIDKDGDRVEGWWTMGWVKMEMDQYNEAINYFQNALVRDPQNVDLLLDLADCCLLMNDHTKQLRFLQQAHQIAPKNLKIYELLGELYEDLDQYSKARKLYEDGLTVDPQNLHFLNHIALILDEYENNFERALDFFNRALKFDKTDQTAINIAVGYFNNEDYDRAQQLFTDLINRGTSDYRPSYYMGLIARDLLVDTEKAAEMLNKSLQLDPGNFLITMDLVDLYLNQMKRKELIPPLLDQLGKINPDDPVIGAYIQEIRQQLS